MEYGDKVVLPASALDQLLQAQIDYPMLFRVENTKKGTALHCGVMEFTAEEGMAYIPYWLMQSLYLKEGDLVHFKNVTLPKGTYVKLRPQTKDFLDVSNPKAVLERNLRHFTCLTRGGTVPIHYNNKRFLIDIVELEPQEAVSIVETDCKTDFDKPLDYVEEPQGQSQVQQHKQHQPLSEGAGDQQESEEASKFVPFAGQPRRLDGKAASSSSAQPSSSTSQPQSSSIAGVKQHGRLVFGGSGLKQGDDSHKQSKEGSEQSKENEDQSQKQHFQAFQGNPRTLRD